MMINPWTLLLARCCCISMLLLSLAFTSNATTKQPPVVVSVSPTASSTTSHPAGAAQNLLSSISANARRKRVPLEKHYTEDDCLSDNTKLPAPEGRVRVSQRQGKWRCEFKIHIALPDTEHVIQLNFSTFQTSLDMRDFFAQQELQRQENTTTTTTTTAATTTTTTTTSSGSALINGTKSTSTITKKYGNGNINLTSSSSSSSSSSSRQEKSPFQQQPKSRPTSSSFERLKTTKNKNSHQGSVGKVINRDYNNNNHINNRNPNTDRKENKLDSLVHKGEAPFDSVGEQNVGTRSSNFSGKQDSPSGGARRRFQNCVDKLIVQDTSIDSKESSAAHPLVLCLESTDSNWVYNYQSDLWLTLAWDPRKVSYFALAYRVLPSALVPCEYQCDDRRLCLLERQLCDEHVDCADGSDEGWLKCMVSTHPQQSQSSEGKSHMVIIGVSVGVVLILVPAVLMIHFKCRSNLRQQQDSLLQQQQRPHSLSSEMYQSPSGSVQESGIQQYDQRASLLQDQHQHQQQQQQQQQQQTDSQNLLHPSHRQHSLPTHTLEEAPYTILFSSLPERSPLNTHSDCISQRSPRDSERYEKELRHESYPHHIAISRDGEEGYQASQLALRSDSQSLIQQQVFRPPPNKTIFDRASPPPPYSLNPPGAKSLDSILPTVRGESYPLRTGQSCESSNKNKSQASPPHVLRCHSMSYHRPDSSQRSCLLSSRSGPPPDYHQIAPDFPPNLPVHAGSGSAPQRHNPVTSSCCGMGGPHRQDLYSHIDIPKTAGANNTLNRSSPNTSHTPSHTTHILSSNMSHAPSKTSHHHHPSSSTRNHATLYTTQLSSNTSHVPPPPVSSYTPSNTSHVPPPPVSSYTPSNTSHVPPPPVSSYTPSNTSHVPPPPVSSYTPSNTSHVPPPPVSSYTPSNTSHVVPCNIPSHKPSKASYSPSDIRTHGKLPDPPFGAYSVPSAPDNSMFVCTRSSPSICPCPSNHVVSSTVAGTDRDECDHQCRSHQEEMDGSVRQSDGSSSWPCSSSSSPPMSCSSFPSSICMSASPLASKSPSQTLLTHSLTCKTPFINKTSGADMPKIGSSHGATQDTTTSGGPSPCVSTITGPTSNQSKEQYRDNIYSFCNNNSGHCNMSTNYNGSANVLYDNHCLPAVCCGTCYDSDIQSSHVLANNVAVPNISFPTTTGTNTSSQHQHQQHQQHHHHHHHHHHPPPPPHHLHCHQQPYQAHNQRHLTASSAQDCTESVSKMSLSISPSHPFSSLSSSSSLSPSPSSPSHSPMTDSATDNCKGDNFELKLENNGNVFRRAVEHKPAAKSLDSNGNTASISARGKSLANAGVVTHLSPGTSIGSKLCDSDDSL